MALSSQHVQPYGGGQKRSVKRLFNNEAIQGFVYISPWIFGFFFLQLAPLIDAFRNSFTKSNIFRMIGWVGWQNYQTIFTNDPTFTQVTINMAIYVVCSTAISLFGGLGLALLLNREFRGNHVFRTIVYVPTLLVGIAIGYLFKQVFRGGDIGLANMFLGLFGIAPLNWIGDSTRPWLALVTLILTNFWFIGGTMIIFLAGLKSILPSYYEAAEIDGANSWQIFIKVTLPLLSPVLVLNTIMILIGHLQAFDIPIAFANSGGISTGTPLGYKNSLGLFQTYLYVKGFIVQDMGYASALGFIFFAIMLIVTALVFWLARRFTYYGEQERG